MAAKGHDPQVHNGSYTFSLNVVCALYAQLFVNFVLLQVIVIAIAYQITLVSSG